MIRILIADDQRLVRSGFRMILGAEPDIEVVGEASTGSEAIEETRRLRPDVVLMDIRMPEMDGVEATRHISGDTRVIILTTFDLDEYVVEALRAGASGFLLKDVRMEDLSEAIRVVARGDALLAPAITRKLLDRFAVRGVGPPAAAAEKLARLTDREREVLELVARGMSNAEVASALYVGDTTVKTHVSHLLMKLEARDRVQLVVFAYESGIITPGQ